MPVETKILTTLIANIKTLLESVTEIKEVKAHPFDRITEYPAIIFTQDTFENSFSSVSENEETQKFKIWIIISTAQTTLDAIFERILPNAIDSVKEKFNAEWDGGTIDGHRVRYLLESGITGLSEGNKGPEAWAELTLTVKLMTNN